MLESAYLWFARAHHSYSKGQRYIATIKVDDELIGTSDWMKFLESNLHKKLDHHIKKMNYAYQRLLRIRGGLSSDVKLLINKQVI